MPSSHYTGSAIAYWISRPLEGPVECSVELETDTFILTVEVESLALAADASA